MTSLAAFQGDYCDLKFIKTRKVAQITIEIPIERAAEFVAAFGAPDSVNGVPVAVARMEKDTPARKETPARKSWLDLELSQQAAMRCNEPDFREWLRCIGYITWMGDDTPENAARCVRDACQVKSRSELNLSRAAGERWRLLDADFYAWQRGPR